jgi:2-iminobutanoate/2-iminopropanoate deaminase
MAQKQIIKPAKSAPAVGPYNHAVRIGDLLFCAGQIPIEPATGNLVAGDIKIQTDRVLQNVKAILDDQKLGFGNIVKSTVFLTNLADFAGMNEVYAKYFTSDFPARSTIQVAALPKGATVEIEVIAHF